jgi:hypothetical protein
MYEPWFGRVAAEDLTQIDKSAAMALLRKVDLIAADHVVREAESFRQNVGFGQRVVIEYGSAWYVFDYQILREHYLLVIHVAGPFQRVPLS